ncbi:MAG: NAD(P)H-hydrate dehydratase, partial [Verrucomicrobiota bacterium]
MVLTGAEMKATEEAAFARGVSAEALMDQAGLGCANAIQQWFPYPGSATLYVGKGHNAGDAYVIGRHLRERGWQVSEQLAFGRDDLAPLTQKKRQEWIAAESRSAPPFGGPTILIDGLLGIGAKGGLRGFLLPMAEEMEERRQQGSTLFAIDLPSGLPHTPHLQADVTLTIGFPKEELLADEVIDSVGRLVCLPLPDLRPVSGNDQEELLTASSLRSHLPLPPFSQHKGQSGRVGIIAGSAAYPGAAILSCLGALRSGAGLLHLFYPQEAEAKIIPRLPPEVMATPFERLSEISGDGLKGLALGPGLSSIPAPDIVAMIQEADRPMVVDAEGLNALAAEEGLASLPATFPAARVLTPHPGEMARLQASTEARGRREQLQHAAQLAPPESTILLKGSRSLIQTPGHPLAINS